MFFMMDKYVFLILVTFAGLGLSLLNEASNSAKDHSLIEWSEKYLREESLLSFFNVYELSIMLQFNKKREKEKGQEF